jgi:predicted Zn-dependent protease
MPKPGLSLSIEDETKLGETFVAQITQYFELIEDPSANAFINDLGNYLIEPILTKPFPFRFYILNDGTLNAFAGPGGHIFMFSGLINRMDQVEELAAVLCHEVGHITARHISDRIEQAKKINIATLAALLAGALIGGELGGALATGGMAAGLQAQLHYSREDERQADQLGYKYMTAAGFDMAHMITALRKIEEGQWFGTDRVPAYLQTHPTGPERMSNLDNMLSQRRVEPPADGEQSFFQKRFLLFKTLIRAITMNFKDAEIYFKRQVEMAPSNPLSHFGLGLVYKEHSDFVLAITHLKKALEMENQSPVIMRHLGETYQMNGEDQKAVSTLQTALKFDPNDKTAQYLLAVSYENLDQYHKAIKLLTRLTYLEPVNRDVYYHLGLSHGRLNHLALAHYYFGLYFKIERKGKKALFHFRKASELAEKDPVLKEKIRKATSDLLRPKNPAQ